MAIFSPEPSKKRFGRNHQVQYFSQVFQSIFEGFFFFLRKNYMAKKNETPQWVVLAWLPDSHPAARSLPLLNRTAG